eukprot:s541_g14.t1
MEDEGERPVESSQEVKQEDSRDAAPSIRGEKLPEAPADKAEKKADAQAGDTPWTLECREAPSMPAKDAGDMDKREAAEDMVKAVKVLQRFYRLKKYRWFDMGRRIHPVQLPQHPGDQQIPVGIQPGRDPTTAWHNALRVSSNQALSEGENRLTAALSHLSEVGRFAAACRAAAVLAVHEVLLHPYGMDSEKHSKHHGPDSPREVDGNFKPPQLVTKDDPLWPLVRPRFDGDRVYIHDSIVLTVVGGNTQDRSQEFAWRLYQQDVKGFQALADAIYSCTYQDMDVSLWALPVAVLVDYLGFRVLCRPQILAVGDPPAELVLGPFAEAEVAYGAPGDLPELWREATTSMAAAQKEQDTNPVAYPGDSAESRWRQQLQTRSKAQFASLVLHEWDRRHPELRQELAAMAAELGLQGYPVCLISDLPKPLASTSLLRLRSHSIPGSSDPDNPEGEELHFRSPAEVLPPEINLDPKPTDSRIVDPVKRMRREALWSLSVPPLPPTHAVTAAANTGQRVSSDALKELSKRAQQELPQQVLDRISSEGPPLDSRGWTEVLHASGVNIRHMSRVAALASASAAASLQREASPKSVDHFDVQPQAGVMLKQSLSRILFQAPAPSYAADLDELIWIPKTRGARSNTAEDNAIPALLMQSPSAKYIIMYFHCNGVDLGMCRGFCNVLRRQFRVHVLAVEYPGYGLHNGTPNPESIEETANSAMDFILDHLQWPVDSVMIFGRSIGTGPAMAIAATPGLAGLILVSPFLSVQELIRDRIGSLAGFCEDFFVAKDAAPKVKCPTFILHGQADEVVSSNHGKTLYKMLVSRKLLVMPTDMRHNSSLLSNLQHFVLPMFHFFSLPETCERELQVPCWAYHRRLAAQRALYPKVPRMVPEDSSVPVEDCGEAVEVESLSSKTTSESCGRQLESFTPVASTLQSWEAPIPDAHQPNKSVRVNENKISTKNAFELPLIEHMDDIVDSFMGGKKAPKKEKEKVRKSSATAEEAEMESRFHEVPRLKDVPTAQLRCAVGETATVFTGIGPILLNLMTYIYLLGFLRLVTAEGKVLVDNLESLQDAGLRNEDHVTAVVRPALKLAATERAFALWYSGADRIITWGDPHSGGDSSGVQDLFRNVQEVRAAKSAFAALLADGSVVAWGEARAGGDSSAVKGQLKKVQQIQATERAFAAIVEGGSVVTWGSPDEGGDSSEFQDELQNVQQLQATAGAFAAILADGSAFAWGDVYQGGDSSEVEDKLQNVQQVKASAGAFAAILADGSVVAWGNDCEGGDCSRVQDQLKNVQQIQASESAFAAILVDRSVVLWGNHATGILPADGVQEQLKQEQLKNVRQVQATTSAFAAILHDGSVVCCGSSQDGGDCSAVQDQLQNVQQVQATRQTTQGAPGGAFAAILGDGSVVSWGHPESGGNSTAVQDQLRNAQQLQATGAAFTAILADGSVVSWGHSGFGGDSSAVKDRLKGVRQVHASARAFTAISADGSVVSWGDEAYGGDNSTASCTIEASARIYACRVDCVHTDTYRVLGGLNSADVANEEDGPPGEDGKPVKKRRICGVNTLEKNEANLVQQNIEADEQSDPMFRRMAAAFDAGGAKGLLLSHLPLAEAGCGWLWYFGFFCGKDKSVMLVTQLASRVDGCERKAQSSAESIFKVSTSSISADAIGLGEPASATSKIEESRLCPELDSFRRQLWGDSSFTMPKALEPRHSDEDLLGVAVLSGPGTSEALAACTQPQAAVMENEDMAPPDMADGMAEFSDAADGSGASAMAASPPKGREKPLPLVDMSASQVLAAPASSKDDVVAFDELFEKFCGAGGSNQFAYFDECWSKLARDKGKASGALADAEGALAEERQSKRPLFDLTNLDKAAKPIETEAVGKHQINEKASQWQLRTWLLRKLDTKSARSKDVPPYMIDRITMPSWQTWSKVDFACLGLRPHLMLKLVRKPPPPTEGPHGFSELFSTVVVENNEAFPWLASEKSTRREEDMEELGEDEDGGLPAHLEELFLGPDDKVLPGADEGLGDVDMDDLAGSFMANGLDFELAEKPTSAENVDIGYSRNSKFVDVKMVKKHLWGCLEKDLASGSKESNATHSFQDLVSRTVSAMPKGDCENLSAAVCFICALHLCNEKNLELKTDPANPLGDFAIDVLHWSEDFPATTPFPIPQKGCVVPICAAPPLFTQDAPEMIDADVCPTSLYHTPKSCACTLLSCNNAKEVTRWHTNFAQRGSHGQEALARSVKWLLRKRLWKKKPWAPVAPQVVEEVHMGPERTASLEVLKVFNLVLGSGADSEEFWEQQLVPEASRRFNFAVKQLQRHHVKAHALFQAMEHHCRVKFELDAVNRPFFKPGFPNPLKEEDLALFTSTTVLPSAKGSSVADVPKVPAQTRLWIENRQCYRIWLIFFCIGALQVLHRIPVEIFGIRSLGISAEDFGNCSLSTFELTYGICSTSSTAEPFVTCATSSIGEIFGTCSSSIFAEVFGIRSLSTIAETFGICSTGTIAEIFGICSFSSLDELFVNCSTSDTAETFSGYVIEEFFGLNRFIRDLRLKNTTNHYFFEKPYDIPCFVRSSLQIFGDSTMTTSTSSAPSGIPLQEYRKDVPPGWAPGLPDYPLRLFFERVKVWYRLYDGPDETVGPLLAGRLVGRAQKIALSLRLADPHGNIDVGDAALVRLSVDEVRDPTNPAIILQQAIPSGVQALMNALKDAFGEGDQLRATQSLENFFDLRRGRLSLAEYSAEWTMRMEEAFTHAGLDINDVAKTFLYFRGSQLPQRHIDDIVMQIHGDLSRFQEARALALRVAHRHGIDGSTNHYEQCQNHYIGEEDWNDSGTWSDWYDPWYDDEVYYDMEDDGYAEYYGGDEDWPDETEDPTAENSNADHGEQQPQHDQPQNSPDNYYKRGIGIGCTVCGSKWHEASVCPMASSNYGKGKTKGKGKFPFRKGKGKGKGKWSKGKGKQPWYYRGKGKGRYYYEDYDHSQDYEYWPNEYYFGKEDRKQMQLQHAREGMKIDIDNKTSLPSTTSRASTSTSKTLPSTTSKEEDFPTFGKKIVAASNATASVEKTPVIKTLSFPMLHDPTAIYHQVRGDKRRGLLVDPGAGAGIIGSETLRDIIENVPMLKNNASLVEWTERSTSVTGISGQGDATLAHVTFPFPLAKGLMGTFSADVLGNEGSLCPALLPNPSLRRIHASVMTQWFTNGDGLLVFRDPFNDDKDEVVILRILLTDSGHYILPIDQEQPPLEKEEQNKIMLHMHSTYKQAATAYSDIHPTIHNLYNNMTEAATHMEPEQGELTTEPNNKPQNDKNHNKDHWRVNEDEKKIVRVHVRPRIALFVPQDDHCPVPTSRLKSTRSTIIHYQDGTHEIRADDWPTDGQQQPLHHQWTGETVFELLPDSLPEHHLIHDDNEHIFQSNDLETYQGDYFPDHISDAQRQYLTKRYAAIPEMFYTRTRRPVVRPDNVKQWMKKQKGQERYHLWELCSGSGRLSLLALLSGLSVLFPVDLRYGWDIGYKPHQHLLQEVLHQFTPDVVHKSPNCRPWSVSFNRCDPAKVQQERDAERPCLSYLESVAWEQHKNNRGSLLEQPWSSAAWKELELPGQCRRSDQCRYGAANEHGEPILKPTGFNANFELRFSCNLCRGHGGKPHAWLQGQHQGVNRTAAAAVYPERLCRALIRDIKIFCERVFALPVSNPDDLYYTCPRCSMGRWAPKHEQHTFMPGECRYGKWPEGQRPKTIKQIADEKQAERDPDAGKTPSQIFRDQGARNQRIKEIKISTLPELPLDDEHAHTLKYALYKIVEIATKQLEDKKNGYSYWIEDQIILHWIKTIFSPAINVSGVLTHIQPWTKPTPTPTLRIEDGYLRLMIRGGIWSWRMLPIEDLREMSNHQWHEATELEDDWLITLFGKDPSDTSSSSASSSSARRPLPTPREGDEEFQKMMEAPLENPYQVEDGEDPGEIDDNAPNPGPPDDGEEPQDEQVSEEIVPVESKVIKPIYDFRRVYKRLPLMASRDPATTKRLLLGLHERLWHCPVMDFRNILIRCNMPPEVLRLAADAVAACTVCRKFVRATRRPQVKTDLAMNFNDVIQLDIFYYKGDMFLLVVDEATRYKCGGLLESRELQSILSTLTNNWLRFFGPPRQIIADQETSIMTQEAGAEMDRLNIARRPKGTTTGKEGKRHTGTGLVEKHVDLTKNCMNKIHEEALRFNITVEKDELLSEAVMAQNCTLNYGGYTPSMCVFGTLPRGFMNVDDINLAVEGSDPTTSTFERAARLRQIALTAVQTSIYEERLLRAGRTRPQQVDVSAMVPGTTQVEIFREDPSQSGHGWRGPAQLLDLDEGNGTVIVKYQGRPYLMSIRHIRPFRGHFFNQDHHHQQEQALHDMQSTIDSTTPYKLHNRGQVYKKNRKTQQMEWQTFPPDLDLQNDDLMKKAVLISLHFGMSALHGFQYGRGVKTIHVPMFTKGILLCWPHQSKECVVTEHLTDHHISMKKSMFRALDEVCFLYLYKYTFFLEDNVPVTSTSRLPPVQDRKSSTMSIEDATMTEPRTQAIKRDGPETRSVVIGQERKKQRLQFVMPLEELHLRSLWWMLQRPILVNWDPLAFFETCSEELASFASHRDHEMQRHAQSLFNIPCRTPAVLHVDLREGHVFRVDEDTDVLTEADLAKHWHDFEVSDAAEIKQFVDEKAFTKLHITKVTDSMTVRQLLQKKGIQSPVRQVALIPPANVWRHLAAIDANFAVEDWEINKWLLLCEKPIYGLNDAPLAWQLNIHEHLESQGGVQSVLDENLFFWKSDHGAQGLQALITTHVDDLAVCSNRTFLNQQYKTMTAKYGKVSLQTLPFSHCGSRYSATATGLRMDQQEFSKNLKEVPINNAENDERDLTKEEQSTLRSQLGGLLWLAATRLDLVADIGVLQSYVTKSKVKHLKAANMVVKKAKDPQFQELGLVYQRFSPNASWRLMCIHDASAPSKQRDYAQEGVLVLLAEDKFFQTSAYEIDGENVSEETFGGKAHVLWSQGSRAKRISYSTSHGETLAAINGMETSSLVSLRIGELISKSKRPTLQELAALQEHGNEELPIDHYTDCRDLFELVTGEKTLPQDKAQRIYTLALKEARLCGRIRWFILIPTQCMTSDALTKPMFSRSLLHLLSAGFVYFANEGKHLIFGRRLPKMDIEDETNLEYEDRKIVQALFLTSVSLMPKQFKPLFLTMLCSFLLPTATSSSTASGSGSSCAANGDGTCASESESTFQGWSSEFLILAIAVTNLFTFVLLLCCCCCQKKNKTPKNLKLERPKPKDGNSDFSLLQLIQSHEKEIKDLKNTLRCRDEEIESLQAQMFSHDVVVTQTGHRWHKTAKCSSVQNANAHKVPAQTLVTCSPELQHHFPHLTAVKVHWSRRLQHYDAVRIVCARGEEWVAAVSAPTKHTRENRWDRVFQVLQLQLTLTRAIGDSCGAVGGILQGIAVALLEMAKQKVEKPETADEIDEIATAMLSSGPKADKKCLKKTLWAADAAAKMLPSTISAWWAHLAAMEAEWLLDKKVEAHARVQRLQADWDRFCPDQPVLMLRLEGTAARLYAQQGDWSSAAMHTERCCALAERAFGRTHNATVALRARLGDAWSRREDWDKAIAAYQEAYSVAQVSSDEKTTGRLAFELAQVLHFKGDLTGAKGYAEDAVKLLIPLDVGRSDGDLSGTSFEALMLLSRVYEDLCVRFLELHETEQAAVSPAQLQALITKAIKCFETVLKNLPASEQVARHAGTMSRAAQIIESVLRLKVMGLGDSEYSVLVDAVEELLLHAASASETTSSLQRAISQTRGVRQLQPRAETRAAALRPVSSTVSLEVPEKLMELFEEGCHCLYLAYKFFFRPGKELKQYGQWAVVTGATDGIGKAYAMELARQGLNVLLVARSEERLTETAKELKGKYPVTIDQLKVDFSNFDAAARQAVREKVATLDVGILINNVGLSYPYTKYFHELKDQEVADIMEVNMSRIVLGDESGSPGMLSRRRGAIVNTSSGSGRATSPLLAEYSAAKAYVERFSMGLGAELASKGIHVQAQTPLYVTTKMAKIRKSSMTVPSPQSYVECAARHIGYEAVISPWWAHSLQLWLLALLPEAVSVKFLDYQHQAIRKKGMKKDQEKAEEKKGCQLSTCRVLVGVERLASGFHEPEELALINHIPPSSWFDRMVHVVAAGFAGPPVPGDPTYLATIQMLELCRFFGNAARVIMCASSEG